MNKSNILKEPLEYLKAFAKWLAISLGVGLVVGVLGSIFHMSVEYATEMRGEYPFLVYFLPIGGLVIVAVYHRFKGNEHINTNLVLEAVRDNSKIPLIMVPLIYIGTCITHLFGGSAGREGAALQLGGSLGYNIGRLLKLKNSDMRVIIMAGMGSAFAAFFGTPLTAAVFSLEVVSVGMFNYAGFLPCIVSSLTAFGVSRLFGITPVHFALADVSAFNAGNAVRVAVLAVLCALVCILFCRVMEKSDDVMEKLFHNAYVRVAAGGLVIILLTVILGTNDYNGAGMHVIERAMAGEARFYDFALKLLFTAITLGAGFKGGEIVPAFFVGSTFGCAVSGLLGLSPSFGAAIGFVSLFCGVVNCPVASLLLAVEVFGTEGLLLFAICCGVSYMMSGYCGLYRSQQILYSKLESLRIDINAK